MIHFIKNEFTWSSKEMESLPFGSRGQFSGIISSDPVLLFSSEGPTSFSFTNSENEIGNEKKYQNFNFLRKKIK